MPNIIRLGGSGSGGGAGGDLNVYTGATPPEDKTGLFLQTEVEPSKIIFDQKKYGGGTWEAVPGLPSAVTENLGDIWVEDDVMFITVREERQNTSQWYSIDLRTGVQKKYLFDWYSSGIITGGYRGQYGYGGIFVINGTHIVQPQGIGDEGKAAASKALSWPISGTGGGAETLPSLEAAYNSGQDPIIHKIKDKFYISHAVRRIDGYETSSSAPGLTAFDPISKLASEVTKVNQIIDPDINPHYAAEITYPASAVIDGVIWYIGGAYYYSYSGTSRVGNSNAVYGIHAETGLVTHKQNAPKRFFECAAFSMGNTIVLAGGMYHESPDIFAKTPFNHFWHYDLSTDLWTERPDEITPYPINTNSSGRYNGVKTYQFGDSVYFLFKSLNSHRYYRLPHVLRIKGSQLEMTEILVTPDSASPSVDLISSDEIRLTMGIKAAYQQNEQTLNKIPAYINNGSGWEPIE